MGFDSRDIRPAMDVYTLDNVYLGVVLRVLPGRQRSAENLAPEEARQSSYVSGELLGPMPTEPIGNPAPHTQAARRQYATQPDNASEIGRGTLEVGKWRALPGKRRIPVDAVLNVSLERVILRLRKPELDG